MTTKSRPSARLASVAKLAAKGALVATVATLVPTLGLADPQAATAATASTAPRPGPETTGVPSGFLLRKSGSISVTKPGTVIEGLDVDGSITIYADNVTVRNTRVRGTGMWGIRVASGSASIVDSEISGTQNGIVGSNWRATRVEIFGTTGDGVKLGGNVLLENSWIHSLTPAPRAHADGAQAEGSAKNVVVRNNVIDASNPATGTLGNSAILLKNDFGSGNSPGPVTIVGNYLNGGNYTLMAVPGNNGYTIANISVRDNRFGPNARYGAGLFRMPVSTSGNVLDVSGRSLF